MGLVLSALACPQCDCENRTHWIACSGGKNRSRPAECRWGAPTPHLSPTADSSLPLVALLSRVQATLWAPSFPVSVPGYLATRLEQETHVSATLPRGATTCRCYVPRFPMQPLRWALPMCVATMVTYH